MADNIGRLIKAFTAANKRKENFDYGLNGLDIVNATSGDQTLAGDFVAIKVDNTGTTGAHFSALATSEGDDLDGIKLAPGDMLYAPISSVTIESDNTDCLVMLYRKNKA